MLDEETKVEGVEVTPEVATPEVVAEETVEVPAAEVTPEVAA